MGTQEKDRRQSVAQSSQGRQVEPTADLISRTTRGYKKMKDLKEGIVGLKNNSLYCYMNAILQCLMPIEEMRDYYLGRNYKRFEQTRCISNSFDYSDGVSDFFREAFEYDARSQGILNPTQLKNLIRRQFYPTMQHDSHEFFIHVLSQLQDEETPKSGVKFNGEVTKANQDRTLGMIYKEYFDSYPSCIDRLFMGIIRNTVRCGSCNYESITYKPLQAF